MIRGGGVYQPAVDLCIKKLAIGEWVHIFPEGKVNMTKEHLRFKWGVGRMIYEAPIVPIIIPIWHLGMDDVLPNYPPYIFKFGKKITVNVGEPIDINDLVNELKSKNTPEPEARKIITDHLQEKMTVSKDKPIGYNRTKYLIAMLIIYPKQVLRAQTEKLHEKAE